MGTSHSNVIVWIRPQTKDENDVWKVWPDYSPKATFLELEIGIRKCYYNDETLIGKWFSDGDEIDKFKCISKFINKEIRLYFVEKPEIWIKIVL